METMAILNKEQIEKWVDLELAGTAMSSSFTSQEVRDLEFVYRTFDVNGQGFIEGEEVRKGLRLLGFKVSHKIVQHMLQDLNSEQTKKLRNATDFEGFLEIVAKLQGSSYDQHEEFLQAFKYMDSDGDGYVTLKDLSKYSPKIGLSSSDVKEMLAGADKDGDGRISREEFLTIMKQTNLVTPST